MDANITIFSHFPMPFQRFFISGASGKTVAGKTVG